MKKLKTSYFALLFIPIWVGLTLFNAFKPVTVFSENENRYLKEKPTWSFDRFIEGEFMAEMDEYVNDQFIFRDQWIQRHVGIERAFLKQEINRVYFGSDDYLIEHHWPGLDNGGKADRNIKFLTDFVVKQSESLGPDRVKVMLVPSASEVITDKLPIFAHGIGFDQSEVLARVEEGIPSVSFVDVREPFLRQVDTDLFYRTDHHWTTPAAYIAYETWVESLGWTPLPMTQNILTDSFYGTLHSKVNTKRRADTILQYLPVDPQAYRVTYNQERITDTLYDMNKLDSKDKYSVFLGGNNPLVKIESFKDTERRLLVVKDSFAHAFIPFAVNHYETTTVVDLRYYFGSVNALIEEEGITDVLVLYNVMGFVNDDALIRLNKIP